MEEKIIDSVQDIGIFNDALPNLVSAEKIYNSEKTSNLEKIDNEKQGGKTNLGELDANLQEVDFKQRAFLKELLSYKKELAVELEKEDLDVLVQERLEQALEMIQHIISINRFVGF